MQEVTRTREEVVELVMKLWDRLESGEFEGMPVLDAVLLVELDDPDDTIVIAEATTERATVQLGILKFAIDHGVDVEEDDDSAE